MGLAQALDALIAADKNVQIQLRHQLQPLGPGKCERITQPDKDLPDEPSYLYRLLAPAMMQATPQSRPQKMLLPIIFHEDDLQMIIEDPINVEGEKAIVTPPPGNGSGLIIGGR